MGVQASEAELPGKEQESARGKWNWQSHLLFCAVGQHQGTRGSCSLQQAGGDLVIAVPVTHLIEHSSLNGTALTGLLTYVCSLAPVLP